MKDKFAGSNHAKRMQKRLIEVESVKMEKSSLESKVDTTLRVTCITTPYDGSSSPGGEAKVTLELHHILSEPLKVKDFKDSDGSFLPLKGIVQELVSEMCLGCDKYDDFSLNLEEVLSDKLEKIYHENQDEMEYYMRLGRRVSKYFFSDENGKEGLDVEKYRNIIMDVETSMLDQEALDEK